MLLRGFRLKGKTKHLRHVLAQTSAATRVAAHRSLPLPPRDLRALLARDLVRTLQADQLLTSGSWGELFEMLAGELEASRRPLVLAVDDAQHLLSGREGIHQALAAFWGRLRAHALPVHLVLCGTSPHLEDALEAGGDDLRPLVTADLRLGPPDLRSVARRLPDYEPRDRVRTWAVFGGFPDALELLDPGASLEDNVQRLLLAPDGPLRDRAMQLLQRDVQSPARYASILRALATGAREWGAVARGSAGFRTGSQMAPYLGRLEELGLVRVRRSLDAGPRTRSRRYEIVDPLVAFWFRYLPPVASRVAFGPSPGLWDGTIRPGLDLHVARLFPRACRSWLRRHGQEALPARGREVGSLWGSGYDLEVAGTLTNGAAVYGSAHWQEDPVGEEAVEAVGRELRHTRYGFGREGRLRVVFSAGGFRPDALRRAARDPLAWVVGLSDLLGTHG